MYVHFGGYTIPVKSMRQGQMILAQAKREFQDGDIDAWYYANCPIGRGYGKWRKSQAKNGSH